MAAQTRRITMVEIIRRAGFASLLMILAQSSVAGDVENLTALLDHFLAHAGERSAHERFWADDLVYTSSAGTRTNKAEILQGFAQPEPDSADAPVYHAEDVDIRLYGDMAVVTFRLVAVSASEGDEPGEQHYFNTGTFRRLGDGWRAVAWQATRIPGSE